MRLATIQCSPRGRVVVVLGDEVIDPSLAADVLPIAHWVPHSMVEVIAGGSEGLEILRRLVAMVRAAPEVVRDDLRSGLALRKLADVRLAAPVPQPALLLCHAHAYHEHVSEMDGRASAAGKVGGSAPKYPIGFMKNGHAVIGPDAPIVLPESASEKVDFEGEISVVFGRACHGVRAENALDYVFGATIVNDVSARDWVGEMREFPDRNRMGKQFAGFAPMGPWIVTLDELPDLADLHLTTDLNGQRMQDASTRDLIWSIPELIEYYSRWYPFQPGDVLTTGSPAGVGFARDPKIFLRAGDTVSISVDGIGTLTNPVQRARS